MEQLVWETAEELDQKLAQRVRKIRKRRSISQMKLASMSGCLLYTSAAKKEGGTMKKVYVIGHRNPDTDSICSAIAYANLKNQVEGNGYEAYRAGNINGETRYVLDTFGIKDPKYVSDVRPRLKDVNLNLVKGAKATDSLKSAREMMQTEKIVSLPVLDGKKMIGLVSISDVLKADMDVYDNEILAKAKTPYKNVVETLDGTLQAGDIEGYITEGKLTVSDVYKRQ